MYILKGICIEKRLVLLRIISRKALFGYSNTKAENRITSAIVANPHKTTGNCMKQEPGNKGNYRYRQEFVFIPVVTVNIPKRNISILDFYNALVGNRNAIYIRRKILYDFIRCGNAFGLSCGGIVKTTLAFELSVGLCRCPEDGWQRYVSGHGG